MDYEDEDSVEIRGEYWIQDGNVDFADGNIGDDNHESIAIRHIFYSYSDNVVSLAEELELETESDYEGYDGGPDIEAISGLLQMIWEHLTSKGMNKQQAEKHILEKLGVNKEAFQVLWGGGDARLYVMKYEGWIAVRENNVEVYGYDEKKKKHLINGIYDILGEENIIAENVELSVYDYKTKKNWTTTLADLERPPTLQTNTPATTTYNKNFIYNPKDSEENKYSNPAKSKIPQQKPTWRGTSESRYISFLEWLTKKNLS